MDLKKGFIKKRKEKIITYKVKIYSNKWKIYYLDEDCEYRFLDNGLKLIKKQITSTEKAVKTGYYPEDTLLKYKKIYNQFKKFYDSMINRKKTKIKNK